ncbi:GIY-YIG nuclease family protein [Eubacterium sp. 1001713B170207_170306_E7]|uniref:GIY-YIG nuclease family protein n=1 Tax=Eubacterium sp. 1001713B170207_170306_E7 TaxID=2787097 RepID=UPI001A9BF42B|nr:GIY-YIG nuclease family protein [Eubacterium sp. 1001713B170207_170306_E7]
MKIIVKDGILFMDKHYVYILKCKDNSLYTGWTTDIEKRLKAHNSGKGAKYTKGRNPVELVYKEVFDNKGDALRREAAIKNLTRKQKLELIKKF